MADFGAAGRDWLKDSKEWTELISHLSEPNVLHENGEVMPKELTSELKCRQTENLNTKDPCLSLVEHSKGFCFPRKYNLGCGL
jgi:hypothetical protein